MPLKADWVDGNTYTAAAANAVAAKVNTIDTDVTALDLDPRLDDNRTPIDGSVGRTKLDATLSTALGGTYFTTSTTGVLNADNNTNSTAKATMFGVTHYTNSEEPFYGVRTSSDSTTNKLLLGGGNAATNAATDIEIYTAANNTTTTGTLRTNINSAGLLTHRGDLTMGSNTGTAVTISLNSAVANFRGINYYTAGVWRWAIRVNNAAESGSDVGSDLEIVSRTDAGAAKTTVLSIARGTSLITLGGTLVTAASATGGAGLRLPHGTAPTSPVDGAVWTTTAGLFARINGATVAYGTGGGTGDVVGQASSVDSEVALFSGTGGKTIKRATGTGLAKLTSGVLSTATAGTDYTTPSSTETQTNKDFTSGTNTFPTFNQNTTGSAATLTTSRTINGVSFNGSANISTRTVQSVTTSTTLGAAGDYVALIGASGAPTLPTAVSNTSMYWLKNVDTADKTIATTSSQTIEGTTTIVLSANQAITVVSDGSNWRIV